jgi:hypothetical protein
MTFSAGIGESLSDSFFSGNKKARYTTLPTRNPVNPNSYFEIRTSITGIL